MARFKYLDQTSASGKSKDYLATLQAKLGGLPNIFKAMANSPAALNSYMSLSGALSESSLSPKIRESIALAVGEDNACEYCVSAHTQIGGKAGLSGTDIESARKFESADTKTKAVLQFTKAVIAKKGSISDAEFNAAKQAGLTEGEMAEAVATIALNIYTNYFNHVAQTDVDFPVVKLFSQKAA
jgi:uncharacterized peroxidase-related enzyme